MLAKDQLGSSWNGTPTVDPKEIARFSALAQEWWDPHGRFRPIHAFNEARLGYIVSRISGHFRRAAGERHAFAGLDIVDVGCGAGLLCEPLAERGAEVVGIDAAARNIEIAHHHATERRLAVEYRHCLAEHLVASEEQFDVVLNTEVVEHVADPAQLMSDCCKLLKPGGIMIVATLNRTVRAYLLAILAAEHILRWLPKGTHDWKRFLKPDEIEAMLLPHGLSAIETVGVAYSPLSRHWRLAEDTGVNYMMLAERRA